MPNHTHFNHFARLWHNLAQFGIVWYNFDTVWHKKFYYSFYTQFLRVMAQFDTILAQIDTILAQFDMIMAQVDIILA